MSSWQRMQTGQITRRITSSTYARYKQNAKPNVAIPQISFAFFLKAPKRIRIYPVKPMSGVGIPNVFAKLPEITASQFTVALILQGWKDGVK